MLGEGFPMDLDVTNVAPSTGEEASFLDKVKEFKRRADELFSVYKRLEAQRDVAYATPETRASYDRVMGRADNIIGKVQEYVPQIDEVFSFAGALFGMNRQQTLGQLGIAQFLVLGLGALITIMTVWISDAWTESKKLDAAKAYIDQGLSASEAAKLARGEVGGGFLTGVLGGGIGGGVALALVAGGAIFLLMQKGKR
jgi:hypothetical protein